MQVEGIPDGWELVRVGKVKQGEFYVDNSGAPYKHVESTESHSANYVIIRKIEKLKRYRPFANAAEADSMWNAVLKFKFPEFDEENSRFRVGYIASGRVGIGNQTYSYNEAIEIFECIDGTPFGVEVTE